MQRLLVGISIALLIVGCHVRRARRGGVVFEAGTRPAPPVEERAAVAVEPPAWLPFGLEAWPEAGNTSLLGGGASRKSRDPGKQNSEPYDPGTGSSLVHVGLGGGFSQPLGEGVAAGPFVRWRPMLADADGSGGWSIHWWSGGIRTHVLYGQHVQLTLTGAVGRMRWEGEKYAGLFGGGIPESPTPDGHDGWTYGIGLQVHWFPWRYFGVGLAIDYDYFAGGDHSAHLLGWSVQGPIRF